MTEPTMRIITLLALAIAGLGTLMPPLQAAAGFEAGTRSFERMDYAGALRELQPLAAAGDAEAQYMMGAIRAGGRGGLRDTQAAASWYMKAAAQGHALSAFSLGFLYTNGAGSGATSVPADPARAGKWLLQAAAHGIAMAQYLVGTLYADGRGFPADPREALRWMRMAADNGVAGAQFEVGLQHAKGVTAPPDRIEAYIWFWLLSEARYPGADQNRDILARSLSDAERARAEAAAQAWRAAFLARPDVGPRGERRLGP